MGDTNIQAIAGRKGVCEAGGADSSLVCLLRVENLKWNGKSKWKAIKLKVQSINLIEEDIRNWLQIVKTWVMCIGIILDTMVIFFWSSSYL